jgi:hypothetical protein
MFSSILYNKIPYDWSITYNEVLLITQADIKLLTFVYPFSYVYLVVDSIL